MSAAHLLKFLLEQNGTKASDLGRLAGVRTLGSAMLKGERGLSENHIKALARRFELNPLAFLK